MLTDPYLLLRDNGSVWYFHQDRIGNISAVTNSAGQVVEQYRYDAFGMPEFRGGPVDGNPAGAFQTGTLINNRFLFTGREWVARYGFYEYRNRAYHPGLGRFMSEDPLGIQVQGVKPSAAALPHIAPGQLPASFAASEGNLYRYCHNDPINKTDPYGLFTFKFADDYPKVGPHTPGGREAVNRAIKDMGATRRGAELMARDPDKVVIIRPTVGDQKTGVTRDKTTLRLNPKDHLFLDPESRSAFADRGSKPSELPPSGDKGRAVIIGHEAGHIVTPGVNGTDEKFGGRNVRDNENPIRNQLGIPDRQHYSGFPIRP